MRNRNKPLDLDALLGAWPSAAGPSSGFADRVLAACDLSPPVAVAAAASAPVIAISRPARAATPPSARRALFAGAALAAAFVLIPLFVYRTARSSPPSTVAAAVTPDLGFERD